MATISIQSPGFLTTIQDGGRTGYQKFGMPVSGAMDAWSHQLANLLVGNQPGAACLESTLTGPRIVFHAPMAFAVCGADMTPALNGKSLPMWKSLRADAGDCLSFSELKNGCRSYISFAGGIDVPPVLGSRSAYLRGKLAGFAGRPLMAGDELPTGTEAPFRVHLRNVPAERIPDYLHDQTLRIIPGPEAGRFTFEGIRNFLTSAYSITNQSDRMGYRLSGPHVGFSGGSTDIVSSGISPGTIQITSDGQPVILLADRQTTGGYARIANVITVDLPLLAQMKPGEMVRFKEITLDDARELLLERQNFIDVLMQGWW